jgi:predicted RNA-binding protein with TRAM domain
MTPADASPLTMEFPDQLRCVFNAEVQATDDGYQVVVPEAEVEQGNVEAGEVYRIALLDCASDDGGPTRSQDPAPSQPQPPVERGEIRYVEIEDLGKQGDGIARVERGYVIIVPGSEVGEREKIEITEVKSNFAVGEIVEESFD